MQARMRQIYLFAVVAVALVVVLGGTALAQSSNSEVGTWKLNLALSQRLGNPGAGLKSSIVKMEAAAAGIKVTVDSVSDDGTVRHYEYTANYDGKDNPVTGNSQNGDVVALTRIDANTTKTVNKKGGKITVTQTSVVSADGNRRTTTSTGTNALEQSVNSVTVYDKQ